MGKIKERFNKVLNISFLIIALDVVVGILFITHPDISNKVSLMIIGSLTIVHGLYSLINYFYDGLGSGFFKAEFLTGIISVILGIIIVLNPITTINILAIGFGLWLILNGIETGYYTMVFWKHNEEIAPLILFVSVASAIMGVLIIINPFKSFMLVTKLIGLFIIANSCINIIRLVLYKKRAENLLKMFN